MEHVWQLIEKLQKETSGPISVTPPCIDAKGAITYMNNPAVRTALHIPAQLPKWQPCRWSHPYALLPALLPVLLTVARTTKTQFIGEFWHYAIFVYKNLGLWQRLKHWSMEVSWESLWQRLKSWLTEVSWEGLWQRLKRWLMEVSWEGLWQRLKHWLMEVS